LDKEKITVPIRRVENEMGNPLYMIGPKKYACSLEGGHQNEVMIFCNNKHISLISYLQINRNKLLRELEDMKKELSVDTFDKVIEEI
jgi:hypothetical protein